MLQVIKITLLTLICLFHFSVDLIRAGGQESYRVIEETKAELTNPVFLQDIIHIRQPGTITSLHGGATIKYQDKNEYKELKVGDTVGFDDILGLSSDSTIKILSGSQEIKLESKEKIRWFFFEKAEEANYILKK